LVGNFGIIENKRCHEIIDSASKLFYNNELTKIPNKTHNKVTNQLIIIPGLQSLFHADATKLEIWDFSSCTISHNFLFAATADCVFIQFHEIINLGAIIKLNHYQI